MDETTERPRDEARRWKIAYWLNDRNPNICWADLAVWAMGDYEWDDVCKNGRCGTDESLDFAKMGSCWCGKFNKAQAAQLAAAGELLLSQYDSSPDFVMGGKLTNEPFLMMRTALAAYKAQQGE